MRKIKEEDVRVSRLKLMNQMHDSNYKLMTQTQDLNSRLILMTQERIFSIIINQTRTNKAWMVSHDMMQIHEGIPLELNPMLKLLEMRWWGIHTTCLVSLSNDRSGLSGQALRVCERPWNHRSKRFFCLQKVVATVLQQQSQQQRHAPDH